MSETTKERDGVTILTKEECLNRWAEYFEQHLSWSPAATHPEPTVVVEPWTVNVEPLLASEVYDCVCPLKRHRASAPNECSSALFKGEDEVLIQRLYDLFACIWEKETVPDNWEESVIVPIFKERAPKFQDNLVGIWRTVPKKIQMLESYRADVRSFQSYLGVRYPHWIQTD
ncbi:hypothetical protein CLF_100577 [Clonorchis sinensis]|uniref:Uncharacterized protein n=1 Tax=Clonorchis sinensis TaxID=79923 RepID=G7Y3S3_CLOSI|nr:hypothetical protein CLF_100577 [Clonorchis sinensis]